MDEYIRSGMHLQLNKIGRSELDKQKIIEHFKDDGKYQEIKDLNVVGLDLSVLQNQAIHGVQVLLDKTNYKGNQSPRKRNFSFSEESVELPVIQFSPAEFYEACGLKKYETKKGKTQYRSGDKEQVLKALKSLYSKEFVITYNEKTFSEKKNQYIKRHIKYYLKLFGDVKEVFRETGDRRLESITMVMSPIFVAQLDTYNIQKPKDYIAQIKMIEPRASKFVHLFIEHVLNQSRLNRSGGVVKLKEDTLAYQLRMDNFIEDGKRSKIKNAIARALEVAKEMEFISSYQYKNGMVEFKINYDKLVKVKSGK